MSKTAFLGIFAYVLCLPFPPAGGEETLAERSLSCASAAQQLKVFYGPDMYYSAGRAKIVRFDKE